MSDYSEWKQQFYLFKGPFIVCIFSISVDKGIQSLRDDSAVVGGRISAFSVNYFYREVLYVLKDIVRKILLLCGFYWFRIKVSLCIYWCLFLCFGGVAGVHIVRRNGSSDGADAWHWNFENLSIKFLETQQQNIAINLPTYYTEKQKYLNAGAPCVLVIQRSPRTVCGSDAAPLLMPLQSWPNRSGGSNISSNARSDWSKAAGCKKEVKVERWMPEAGVLIVLKCLRMFFSTNLSRTVEKIVN